MYEKDFLRGYELRNWNFSPRIYKIIGIATLANLLAVFVFAQTNLLTRKGCDSPFVSTICQVLDTVYLSKSLLGTDTEYNNDPFNPTAISENDEITFIDVSNQNLPLSYPPGYFPLANPDQFMTNENGDLIRKDDFGFTNDPSMGVTNVTPAPPPPISPPITQSTPNLMDRKPVYGRRNNNPIIGALPGKRSNKNTDKTSGDEEGDLSDKSSNNDKVETADNKTDKDKNPKVDSRTATDSNPVEAVEFNKRPLTTWGDNIVVSFSDDKDRRSLLAQPFKVKLDGKLSKKIVKIQTNDGKEVEKEVVVLDSKESNWIKLKEGEAGNEEMVEIAKQAIEAVGDSGVMGYLYNIDIRNVDITLQQTGDKILINVTSEQISNDRAKTVASGAGTFIKLIAPGLTTEEDLKVLFKGYKTSRAEGKFAIIDFEIDKKVAQEMIGRRLDIEAQKKKDSKDKGAEKNAVKKSQIGK